MTTTPAVDTITGPDRFGRYTITTDRFRILVAPRREYEPLPAAVYVASAVTEAADEELARLAGYEAALPQGRRWAERGQYPDVDNLYDRLNDRIGEVTLAVAREVLPLLSGVVDGDLVAAAETAYFSRRAGCDMCPCSPGVSVPGMPTVGDARVDVWVDPIQNEGE